MTTGETSRQRIANAVSHRQPQVTPVNVMGFEDPAPWLERFGARDYGELCRLLGMDAFPDAPPVYRGPALKPGLDIWGAAYSWTGVRGAGYSGGRGGYPLGGAATVAEVEAYRWPVPEDFDYSTVGPTLCAIPEDQPLWIRPVYIFPPDDPDRGASVRRSRAEWLPILCTLFNLFGMEDALIHLALSPALMEAAIERIVELVVGFSRRMMDAAPPAAEIFWFGDDFSSQTGMIVSPEHWRRYLKPAYARVFGLAKDRGLKVWFHSCGTFRPVLPDLIDIGMDIWETVQAHLPGNDPVELKREYGRDLVFYGGINSQQTLPYGTAEQVRAEVRERVRVLGKGGGYICSSDHTILPGVPFENVLVMIEEAKKTRA
jgi:uroporphyrinogen decarboxylase